jgi:hypothetical protein
MTYVTHAPLAAFLAESAPKRRSSPLLDAADGRQGLLSRSVARGRRDLPDPASPTTPHRTPVPLSAHQTPRAIRVRRSPR